MAPCVLCNRTFPTKQALDQHIRDSPAHATSYECTTCNRSFVNEEALNQHLRDSPVHAPSYECIICNQSFVNEEALNQHLRDSPALALFYECTICGQSFVDLDTLEQHIHDSPVHAPSYECTSCNRSFVNEEALNQHIQNSSAHAPPPPDTPLDTFFHSYPLFPYDPNLPPSESYALLQNLYGWKPRGSESRDAWEAYQNALREEVELWFGAEDDMGSWHALCRAVGVKPPPATCERCREAVRRKYVNIIDLITWARAGMKDDGGVENFENLEALQEYTIKTRKIFSLDAMGGSSNVVLRHLLRFIFR